MKLSLLLFFLGCGSYDRYSVDKPKPDSGIKAYSWSEMQGFCFSCHNKSAPAIPLDEAGFMASAKVKTRIANGTMPPSPGAFDKDKAIAYLEKIKTEDPAKEKEGGSGY